MTFFDFAVPFVLTLVLEGIVALLWRFRGKNWLLFVLVNLLTNPLVVLLHSLFSGWIWIMALELAAIVTEGVCYQRLGERIPHPLCFALTANLFSFGMGLLIDCWI